MAAALIDIIAGGSIDLAAAEIDDSQAGCLRVTARPTATRRALALLCLLVAVFTSWHVWRDVQAAGAVGLWPGIAIVPVFASLAVLLACFVQEKVFDAGARRVAVSGRLFGFRARRDYALPAQGRVRVSVSVDPMRSEAQDMRPSGQYQIDVADHAALTFTVRGDAEGALALATRLAQLLDYELTRVEEDPLTGWSTVGEGS